MGICLKTNYCPNEEPNPSKTSIKVHDTSANTGYRISTASENGQMSTNKFFNEDAEEIILEENEKEIEEKKTKISLKQFTFLKLLGTGSYGKVYLVRKMDDSSVFAMKVLKKKFLEEKSQINHTKTERLILEKMNHPFIVQLHYAFQTSEKLFLVMDFMQGGEMFFHLKKANKFNEEQTRFVAAEIVLAIEYLHRKKIIYRDLKPENILLSVDGHIKLTDFGLSKYGIIGDEKTYSVCGTPEYLAPEIFQREGHDKSVDWWSLGALIYEMLSGFPPFYHKDQYTMFKNTLEKPLKMKSNFSVHTISLLRGLLSVDPKKRLGSSIKDALEIKAHPYFENVNWDLLLEKKIPSPLKLNVSGPLDLRHFDKCFINEHIKETFDNDPNIDPNFAGFTYVKREFMDSKISFYTNNP